MAEVSLVKLLSDGWQVDIGSGNGLVPSGNKPLPEPMLTKIYVPHMVWLGHNGLISSACIHNSWCQGTHFCISKLTHHWFRWLVTRLTPSHYQNQWQLSINWTLLSNFQLKSNQNVVIFIQENKFENVCKMVAILSQPRWVDHESHLNRAISQIPQCIR